MKSSLLKNILLVGRVILPAILCVLLICAFERLEYFKYNAIYFIISSFGIIAILLNLKKIKHNFILSFLISVVLSYAVFFLSIFISGVIKFIFFMRGDIDKKVEGVVLGYDINALLLLIPVAIVSPLLMFYSYRIIFKIEKTSYFIFIKWASIVVLILLGTINDFYDDGYMYIYWQVTMALALQLILYQTELKALFKPKKEK